MMSFTLARASAMMKTTSPFARPNRASMAAVSSSFRYFTMGETSFPSSLRIQMRPPAPRDFAVSTAVSRSFRERVFPFRAMPFMAPPSSATFLNTPNSVEPEQRGKLFHGQLEPEVGLVRPVPLHRLAIIHSPERTGQGRLLYRFVEYAP